MFTVLYNTHYRKFRCVVLFLKVYICISDSQFQYMLTAGIKVNKRSISKQTQRTCAESEAHGAGFKWKCDLYK